MTYLTETSGGSNAELKANHDATAEERDFKKVEIDADVLDYFTNHSGCLTLTVRDKFGVSIGGVPRTRPSNL